MGRTENRLAGWGPRVDARRHTERLGHHGVREPDAPMEHGDAIRKMSLANKVGAINAKLAGARVQSWVTFLSTRPSAHHLPKATTLKVGSEAARLERDHGSSSSMWPRPTKTVSQSFPSGVYYGVNARAPWLAAPGSE